MKWLRYIGAALCVLLIAGTLPSIYLIAEGLIDGQVNEPAYFVGKLIGYVVVNALLAIASIRLFRNARN